MAADGVSEGVAKMTLHFYIAARKGEFSTIGPSLERLIISVARNPLSS
jgi:hypothetical protein